ncbi:MAG TPA: C25 family cysteine peptidase [Chitinophagales bacterium]|nr:C25 family cysteine peptidase [Chitinophagales bacterium]
MKKFFAATVLSFLVSFFILRTESFGQTKIVQAQISKVSKPSAATLLSDDGTSTTIQFSFGAMKQHPVTTPQGDAVTISIDDGTPMLKAGYPDLPKIATSIIIPDDKDMEVTVTNSHYTDYSNINVAPSKGTLVRTIDPSSVAYTYNSDVYGQDVFFPKNLAGLRDPFILRDFRGQTVLVYPFQYNAATKTLRVYSDITVKVSPKNSGSATNVFVRNKPFDKVQTEFSNIYQHQFLNYTNTTSRYTPLDDHGNMLIISYSSFMDEMQPFVDWKNQEGLRTEMVDVSTIGNDATSIKNYVTDYYNTHGLTFLLLVGDAAQVATSSTGAGDSDNEYGYISGNDHYQEFFVGRFSATTEDQVTTQVNRTLEYEKNPVIDDSYSHGVGIASNLGQGIGDDGEADYEHEHNIRTQLLGYTYTDIQELYDGNHSDLGGNDANGDPTSTSLANLVNAGTGLINYTGHGSETSIVTTGFDNTDVNNLTNTHHWPFVWIVGCVTGDFNGITCFAESWARATYNGEPTGSIANFMSTINQYWAEPMEMQDEGNIILVEAESNNIKRTFGGLSINGCFSMNDDYGSSGYDMTDTWTIFGDPSVMVRTAEPMTMTVTHDPEVLLGSNQFTVYCDDDGALVSITNSDTILGTGNSSGGFATIQFANALANIDSVLITVTAFNKVPYIATIPAAAANGPYVVNTSTVINDVSGNNNGLADYNETVGFDITLQNVGSATAQGIVATLTTTDPLITITDNSETFSDIASGASDSHISAFTINVADNVPDGHIASFTTTITDNAYDTWTSHFQIILNAPALGVTGFVIDDSNGNGDGHLDPGETVTLNVNTNNSGHADAMNTLGTLTSSNPYITITNANYDLGSVAAGSTTAASFGVSVAANAPYGADASFEYSASAGNYSANYNFTTTITPAIEDFETGDFTQFDWLFSGNQNWVTEQYDIYEGLYSARSGDISSSQSSTLMITLDVQFADDISFMMKVSSEAGYDSLSFRIDNVSKGHWSGEVDWTPETYPVTAGTHTFTWQYQKDVGWSDGYDCGYLDNIMLPAFEINPVTVISSPSSPNEISCFPNPFSQLTFIDYSVNEVADVTVQVFDVNGKLVKTILNNDRQTPGNYHLGFDGSSLANGNYFCNITIGNKTYTEKLVLNR